MNEPVLCLDVAFRNIGWAEYSLSKQDFVSSGIIKVKGLTKEERKAVKMTKQVENSKLCGMAALSLRKILHEVGAQHVLAELPHSGGQSFTAVQSMSMAAALVSTVCALEDVQLHCIQPSASKRIVDPSGGKVSKHDTIEYVKEHFDPRRLPKAVTVAEHIADAMMCVEVVKRTNPSLLQYDHSAEIRTTRRNDPSRGINRPRQGRKLRFRMSNARKAVD